MQEKSFKIFIDFDGTITNLDVGEEIFKKFGQKEIVDKIITDLLADRISAKDCWLLLCESTSPINKLMLDEFIKDIKVETSFVEFIKYCRENSFKTYVLSDGFDYYIEKILSNASLIDLTVFANKLVISSKGDMIPSFPFYVEQFKTSANCKRDHIIANSGDEDYTVFIGDGNSDKETIEYCDFIFAKKDLLKYCEKERITYFPFKDFMDVTVKLNELVNKKRLKKRHQAELKRREAYLIE